MKKHHALGIVVAIIAFVGLALYSTPTADDDEIITLVRETILAEVQVNPDTLEIVVDDETVTIVGDVETDEHVLRIVEAVKPVVEGREVISNLRVKPPDTNE